MWRETAERSSPIAINMPLCDRIEGPRPSIRSRCPLPLLNTGRCSDRAASRKARRRRAPRTVATVATVAGRSRRSMTTATCTRLPSYRRRRAACARAPSPSTPPRRSAGFEVTLVKVTGLATWHTRVTNEKIIIASFWIYFFAEIGHFGARFI